jgi:A/G-specific adenine glycosylase
MPIVARSKKVGERKVPALDQRAATFRRRLLRWYGRHARTLPWRGGHDPYAVLVSEIMLQQTQVTRVATYYVRFLARYPTVGALASASADAVRDSWEGLGYYARARNLHAAARQVVREHGGVFPREVDGLRRLPGIGRYTAAAVASIAYGTDVGTVDTNISRVLHRVFRLRGPRGSSAHTRRLWQRAESLVPRGRAGDWNQALMDLGATICVARTPRCDACPVETVCGSRLSSPKPRPRARRASPRARR